MENKYNTFVPTQTMRNHWNVGLVALPHKNRYLKVLKQYRNRGFGAYECFPCIKDYFKF